MQIKTEPVQVLELSTWSDPGDNDPIKFKDGTLVEFVAVIDSNMQPRKITLANDSNGAREVIVKALAESVPIALDCRVTVKQEAVVGERGPYVRNKDAWHVVSASLVK